LAGLENQMEKVEKIMKDTITEITKIADNKEFYPEKKLTLEGIEKSLKKRLPDQKGSMLPFAHDIYTALKPYEKELQSTDPKDKEAKERVIAQTAHHFSTHWANQNKAKLVDEFRHLSGVALGAQFVTGWLPMPTFGLSFTKYKNLSYTEDLESFNRMNETLIKGYGADKIEGLSFGQMAENLNAMLKRRYESPQQTTSNETPPATENFLEYDNMNGFIKINKKLLDKVYLHILPELKPYIARQ
jgi:hypothetical protein